MEKFKLNKDFMNANLSLSIVCDSISTARSAAHDAFFIVEQIENALSMYKDSSEVYGINTAKLGEEIQILEYTMECLEIAADLYTKTLGAIDICMGQFFTNAKAQTKIEKPQRLNIHIDKENSIVKKMSEGCLDFGSFGKGYAVDKVAQILKERWLIENALIDFGSSTILALGNNIDGKPWKISLNGKDADFELKDSYALAASSLNSQEKHIIDPLSKNTPDASKECCFAHLKHSACYADALSTAFFILSEDEIKEVSDAFSANFFKY